MRDQKKAEETAAQRYQLIESLLTEGLDAGKAKNPHSEVTGKLFALSIRMHWPMLSCIVRHGR
nr:hypothetical protein [Aneurinibacillus terranovensis]